MKVNELLSEDELDEIVAPLVSLGAMAAKGVGALMRGAKNTPKDISKVPVPSVPTTKQATKIAKQQYKDSWLNKLGFSKNSTVGKWRIDSMTKAVQKRGMKEKAKAIQHNMEVATSIQDKMANLGLSVVSTGFFFYATYDYLMSRWALDPNDPNYDAQLSKLNGEFLMGFIVPKVIGSIGKISSGLVGGLMKMTGLPKAGEMAARWGRHVSRVGEVAAMAWLRTDAGKKWFAQTFAAAMGLFTDAGYALEGLFKLVSDVVKDPEGAVKDLWGKIKLPKVHDAYAGTSAAGSVTKMVPDIVTATSKEGRFS